MKSLWTLGYSHHTPQSFHELLTGAGIRQIADVRDAPISRKAGFGKNQLRTGLAEAGIVYRHFPDLGTPKQLRDAWKSGTLGPAAFFEAYREHLLAVGEADLADLAAWATATPTALLCLESAVESCHRLVVGETLAARYGFEIEHL